MSLLPLPLLFSTWWAPNFDRPFHTMDHNIALAGIKPDEFVFPPVFDRHHPSLYDHTALDFYYQPWMDLLRRRDGTIGIASDKDSFKVVIDVRQFKPEEINVKVVDRCVVVEAKHEERRDEHGTISRQFLRKYLLPGRADMEQLSSTLSSDGVLTITAPLKKEPDAPNERVIKIELTGQKAFRTEAEGRSTTETSVTTGTEKNIADNEIREELTTQGQEEGAKPEK